MAEFKFRLARILRLREAARDERRAALAEAYRAEAMLRQRFDHMGEELRWLKGRSRRAAGPGRVAVDQLLEAQRYELVLRAQQRQLGEQRRAVAEEIARRHEALVGANRDVRVLEKLREKQARRHREEENRREVKRLDEVAQQRAVLEEVP